jgi:NitT/TauT family transport system substrate-binding protein
VRNRPALLGLAVAALLLAAACSSHVSTPTAGQPSAATTAAAKPAHLTWATTGLSWSGIPDLVAQGEGLFAAENLTVDQVIAGQSAAGCQQVLAKAADIGACSLGDLIQAVEVGGAPLVEIVGIYAAPLNQAVLAKPSVKRWSDLKGKTVIVGGPKDNTAYFFHLMARANGLKDSDYDFTYAGSSPARYAALLSGAVEAAILLDPYDAQAQAAGYTELDQLVPKYATSASYASAPAAVNKQWAQSHSDELVRYIRAELKAINWIYDPANKQALFALVGPKLNIDQATFDRLYERDAVEAKFWSRTGEISGPGVQGVLDSLVDLGSLRQPTQPPTKYFDLSYQKQALTSLGR